MSFENAKDLVRKKFKKDKRDAAHDFTHVKRVLRNCELIGRKEKADITVLKYAALFHDYAREPIGEVKGDHAKKSVQMTKKILPKFVPKEKIKEVQHAILAHSRKSEVRPQTLEAKVLWDADKLDFITPICIARYVIQGDHLGWNIEKSLRGFINGLKTIKADRNFFYTKTAKKIVKSKIDRSIKMAEEILGEAVE
jgi:uncharacterized protein